MVQARKTGGPEQSPPWVFFIAVATSGIPLGYVVALMRVLESHQHISVGQLSTMSALVMMPYVWKPLWTPILDVWLRQKHWYFLLSTLAAIGTFFAFSVDSRAHFRLMTGVLLLTNAAAVTANNALGTLTIMVVPDAQRGRVSGYISAGLMVSSALATTVVLGLVEPSAVLPYPGLPAVPMPVIGALLAALMAGCALPMLRIDEPPPSSQRVWPRLAGVLGETLKLLRTRLGWTAMIMVLAPLGTAAGGSLFGAVAGDYHADTADVLIVTGPVAALVFAAGSLLGGSLSDRADRRLAYCIGGGALAACGLLLAVVPPTRPYFLAAGLLYNLASGVAYATFYAMVFELSQRFVGTATGYALLTGGGGLSLIYTTYLVGHAYEHASRLGLSGRAALFGGDGALNVVGIAVIAGVVLLLRRWVD